MSGRLRRDTRERWRLIIRRLDGGLDTYDKVRLVPLEKELTYNGRRLELEKSRRDAGVAWYRERRA